MSIINETCLKRERDGPHPLRKRLRGESQFPSVKKEEASSVLFAGSRYNHKTGQFEYLIQKEDGRRVWSNIASNLNTTVKIEKKEKKKSGRKKVKKESDYNNIFWGTQQSAWMGSVRVKGTIVRSCSRKSDTLAAKILNTRCRQKGITPPNPSVGFLSSEELQAHTQVRTRRKSKSNGQTRSSPFKNIFWGTQQQAWMGNIRVRGTIVRSCSRKSDVQAAKILNSRCVLKGITPPNPDIGFLDDHDASKYLEKQRKKRKPRVRSSGQYIAEDYSDLKFALKKEQKAKTKKEVGIYRPIVTKRERVPERFDPLVSCKKLTLNLNLNINKEDEIFNLKPMSQDFDNKFFSIRSPLEQFDLPPPIFGSSFDKNNLMFNNCFSDLLPFGPTGQENNFLFGEPITSPSLLLF